MNKSKIQCTLNSWTRSKLKEDNSNGACFKASMIRESYKLVCYYVTVNVPHNVNIPLSLWSYWVWLLNTSQVLNLELNQRSGDLFQGWATFYKGPGVAHLASAVTSQLSLCSAEAVINSFPTLDLFQCWRYWDRHYICTQHGNFLTQF